jgi:PAS domain S-box-containing protein
MSEGPTEKRASERGSVAREREQLLESERAARAEAEKARQRTVAILESISDGFFALDRERRFVYVNREAERFWGKPREELLGKDIREVFPQAVGTEGYQAIDRAANEGVTTEFEAASSVVPGAWVGGRAYPSAEGLSVYFRDVSERKRAEEALRESEEFVRQLLRNFPNGSVNVFDRDLRYLLAEGRGLEEEGLSPEVLVGKTLDELFPKESADFVKPYYRRAFAGEDVEFELPLGGRVYSIHAAPLREEDGEVRTIIAVAQDVTERKRAEDELRESREALGKSEEFHRFAVEAGRIGTWDLDLRTEECLISPKMADLMGFSPDQTTVPGARWRESIVPDDRASMASALAASIESGAPFDLEFRIALKEGKQRWLYSRGGVSRDASGKALRVQGASIDVTERKRAEEELRESEERLRRAIGIETVGVIFFKADGSITDSNDAFLRMSGYSREDLVEGLVRWDVMTPPEWMPHSLKAIEEFESTGRTKPYEKEYVRKDGSRWWALFAATRLDDEEGVEFVIDITEGKRAEEALRESEERFRTLMEQSPLAIHVFAPDGTSLRYNEAWKELWDLEERPAAPNIFDEERVRAAGLVPYLEKGAAGSEEVTDPLLYDPAPTRGEPRWLRAFVYPVRDCSGRVFEVALMLEDVTQRKRAQEEHERLLAREWKARAEAEERKRISRELHDRVAHAMGVAHQSLELHDALKHSDPEAASAKMSLAKQSTIEAMNLTRDLAQELRGAEVRGSLSAALSGLIEAAVPPGVERAVCVEGDEALVPPHAREQLFVILREGVRNAVSHSEAGRIYVGVNVSPAEVVGRVEDDGRGFAGEEGANRGGVRSMRERAELVGGTFRSASGSGVGTSIRVTIPLKVSLDNAT